MSNGLTPELQALAQQGLAHQKAGRFAEAAQSYAALLARAPDVWAACYNLGFVYQHLGRQADAASMYARAVHINPSFAEGYNNLGNALRILGNTGAAIEAYRKALEINPALTQASYNLANMLQTQSKYSEAVPLLRTLLSQEPANAAAWDALCRGLLGLGRQEEAIQAFREWESQVSPTPEMVATGLALCRPMADETREARYVGLAVDWPFEQHAPAQLSTVLGLLQYFELSRQDLFRCYRRYADSVNVARPTPVSLLPRRAAGERLRIGYVSGDFRRHVMGRLMLDVIARHDRSRFSILLISTCATTQHDDLTAAFQRVADGFADISRLDDLAAARVIGEADIDVLVDLAGHTVTARPGIYAHHPANFIVTHLGYHGCLGMDAIAAKFTDSIADLPDAGAYQVEKPYYLSSCVFPFVRTGEVPALPELRGIDLAGKFVFAAFTNLLKLSPRCMRAWKRVLDAAPQALLLFSPFNANESVAIERLTAAAGISRDRIAILSMSANDAQLPARYRLVHAVMDTFPYAGGDTTLAALDAGVPVVTLAGQRHAERIGASMLGHLQVRELVAETEDEYVNLAIRLVDDREFHQSISTRLKSAYERLATDASHTRALEKAFDEIAATRRAAETMAMTAPAFYKTLNDALKRQREATDEEEKRGLAQTLARLREEQPDYAPLLRAQGELAHDMRELQLASNCFAALLKVEPDNLEARLRLAEFLLEQGGDAEALMVLEDAPAGAVDNARIARLKARAHVRMRQWAEARKHAEAAVAAAPGDAQALFLAAQAISHFGEIEQALLLLNRVLILAPAHIEAAYSAGVTLAELGNFRDAEKVLRRALSHLSEDQPAMRLATRWRLLQVLAASDRMQEWRNEAVRFSAQYPDNPHGKIAAARLARLSGDLDGELRILLPLAEELVHATDDVEAAEAIGELMVSLSARDASGRLLLRLRERFLQASTKLYVQDAAEGKTTGHAAANVGVVLDFSSPFAADLAVALSTARRGKEGRWVFFSVNGIVPPAEDMPEIISLAALDEAVMAEKIRAQQIDVLLELAGHGAWSKPGYLSFRPAPTQISLPPLYNTPTLGQADISLHDRLTAGQGASSHALSGCAYPLLPRMSTDVPLPRAALGIAPGAPVFGLLASAEGISLRCATLWKTLAERVPQAQFLICPARDGEAVQAHACLVAAGIEPHRLIVPFPQGRPRDLSFADSVDVVLDTVPASDYASVRAASLDGLPVVTLAGQMTDERTGACLLRHMGESRFIAESGGDYVAFAARLALEPALRAEAGASLKAAWADAQHADSALSMQAYTNRILQAAHEVANGVPA